MKNLNSQYNKKQFGLSAAVLMTALLLTTIFSVQAFSIENETLLFEEFDHGIIDWQNGEVRAWSARELPNPYTTSFSDRQRIEGDMKGEAFRNLVAILLDLRVNSYQTISSLFHQNSNFSSMFYSFLESNVYYEYPFEEGSMLKITAKVYMYGENGIARLIINMDDRQVDAYALRCHLDTDSCNPESRYDEYQRHPLNYNRIIIDVRGSSYNPSLFPNIYTPEGSLVYFPNLIPRENRSEINYVNYIDDPFLFSDQIYQPQMDDPDDEYSLYLVAHETAGELCTDIVISPEELGRIMSRESNMEIFLQGEIYILYSRSDASSCRGFNLPEND